MSDMNEKYADPRGDLPILGVIHICMRPMWRHVLKQLTDALQESMLMDNTTLFIVHAVGGNLQVTDLPIGMRGNLYLTSEPDETVFEFPTLSLLQQTATTMRCNVYYIHTKDVTKPNPTNSQWRDILTYLTIKMWVYNLARLHTSDAVGSILRKERYYAGNFWWARSEYIQTLPQIRTLDSRNRILAERWIGLNPDGKLTSIYQGNHAWMDSQWLEQWIPPEYRPTRGAIK